MPDINDNDIKKLNLIRPNIRLLAIFGLLIRDLTPWKQTLRRCGVYLFIVAAFFNIVSQTIEACRVTDARLMSEGGLWVIFGVKGVTKVITIFYYEDEIWKLINIFEENIFKNAHLLTSTEKKSAKESLNFSKRMLSYTLAASLLSNGTLALDILPPSEEGLQALEAASAPDWNSPTKYAAPFKGMRNRYWYNRVGYIFSMSYLTYYPMMFIYSFNCQLIMYLATHFAILSDSLENAARNVQEMMKRSTSTSSLQVFSTNENMKEEIMTSLDREMSSKDNLEMTEDCAVRDQRFDEEMYKYLLERTKQHQEYLLLFHRLNKITRVVVFTDILGAAVYIAACLMGMAEIHETYEVLEFGFLLMFAVVELGVFCWVGNYLTTQTERVGAAAYASLWYVQSTKYQRHLQLVIMRSQRPLKLSVGPFGVVSLELFAKIMNTAYTYYTLMREFVSPKKEEAGERHHERSE
ncbi:Odorant receptor 40 [Blattella germanica]|nr:Odorant receptor 40 [Blattella germanica]